jgi:aminopeptidase N
VTCDDFVAAMAAASGVDFTPFMVWYRQAGTPHVTARGDYDVAAARYTLTLRQECSGSAPWFIPVRVGLVGPDGRDMDLGQETFERMVILANAEQSFEFDNLTSAPVPSLLRNFSAPVVLDFPYTNEQLLHLFAHDSDSFNRWEAGQRLYSRLILAAIKKVGAGETADYPPALLVAARTMLSSTDTDYAFIAEALTLPSEATLAEQMELVDPEALHNARNQLAGFLARGLEDQFLQLYRMLAPAGPYHTDAAEIGRRRMRNLCLGYLNELDSADYRAAAQQQFVGADNMTDQFGALSILANSPGEAGDAALATFLTRWQTEALVVDKWLMVQATSRRPDTAARVKTLLSHPAFDIRNPNKVYALLRNFGANHRFFHAGDGSGYRLLAEQIALIDSLNPQVASRLARCFDRWKKFDAVHQNHARAALTLLKQHDGLSSNVFEVVQKALS